MKKVLPTAAAMVPIAAAAFDFGTLDAFLDARYGDGDAPGGAVLIAQGDSILFERYYGIADLSSGEAVGASTLFNIASVSKQFTVMALLQQSVRYDKSPGLLDCSVSDFFDFPQAWWHQITLRNLASHTSGVPDARPREDRNWCVYAGDEASAEYFPKVAQPDFSPGEYYDYLNPSFILLAKVVEQLSGESFVNYMSSHIFSLAQMENTRYFDPMSMPAHTAHGYIKESGKWRKYDYGEETFFATRPDGGIYSTARDMLAWENALRDNLIVPEAYRDAAYRAQVSVSDSPRCDYQRRPNTWYGLGFFIEHPEGQARKIFHTGDNGGFQAYVAKYPEYDIKIIILENRCDQSRSALVNEIDRVLHMR